MNDNVNEFLDNLVDDIKKTIKRYSDWNVAEYPITIQEGMIASGLIILKKEGAEIRRVLHEKSFSKEIRFFFDPTKINKGTLTIYPSGFYESSFIWDEGAHLAYLGGNIYSRKEIFAERLFSSFEEEEFYQDKGYNPNEYTFICVVVEINAQKEVKIHRSVTLSEGRIVEVPLVAPAHWLAAILDFQNQTNDPDLKQYAIKWNKMTFNIPSYEQNFDPDKNVIFEWREDLA